MTEQLNHNPQPELSEHDAELLSAYIDEMLSDDEQRELEARLLNNAFLRNELAAMRQTVAWMNALPTLKAPRDFTISAEDVAPAEQAQEKRKVIPMQNRNLWYLGSAAAVVIVLIGVLAVFPLTSNQAPVGGDSPESIAFSATEVILPTNDTQAQSLDMADADNDASDDTALFQADGEAYDAVEESAEMDDAPDTANAQAAVLNTVSVQESAVASEDLSSRTVTSQDSANASSSGANIDIVSVQTTATSLAELFVATPTQQPGQSSNFAAPTATAQPLTIGQGGGMSSDSPPAPVNVMAEAESTGETGDTASYAINTGGANIEAEAPVAPQDESQAPEPDSDTMASGAGVDLAGTVGEARSDLTQPSNLIEAVLQAVRQYVESKQA